MSYQAIKIGCRQATKHADDGDLAAADAVLCALLDSGASVHDIQTNVPKATLREIGAWRKAR